jgi:hypothetical protein
MLPYKSKALLAGLLLVAAFGMGSMIAPAYANPIGLQVGDAITIVSEKGVAVTKVDDEYVRVESSLSLTGVVTAADAQSAQFDITGGTITIGDEVYTVNSGGGQVAFDGEQGRLRLRGQGISADGVEFHFGLRGPAKIMEGAIQTRLRGGLASGDERYMLGYAASLDKA